MEYKFHCPHCGRRLAAETEMAGMKTVCPDCGKEITVPLSPEPKPTQAPRFTSSKKKISEKQYSRKSSSVSSVVVLLLFLVCLLGLAVWLLLYREGKGMRPEIQNKAVLLDFNKYKEIPGKGKSHYIFFEAESAKNIEPSFEIASDEQCSGGKYLHNPEGVGSGWTKQEINEREVPGGIGKAEYEIEIPEAGKYILWARVRWEMGCSNCFDVRLYDSSGKEIIPVNRPGFTQAGNKEMMGKDTTFHTWHWYGRQQFDISSPGKCTLKLTNHDDGSRIDLLVLAGDGQFQPRGVDGFNFSSGSGNWLSDGKSWSFKENPLCELHKASNSLSPLVSGTTMPDNGYYMAFSCRNSRNSRIIFDHKAPDEYKMISISDREASAWNVKNGIYEKLSSSVLNAAPSDVSENHLEFFRETKRAVLTMNHLRILDVELAEPPVDSRVGVDVDGRGVVSNLEIHPLEKIHIGCCHYAEFQQHPFTNISGEWAVRGVGFQPVKDNSIAVTGDFSWRNYQISCAVKGPDEKISAGLGFHYRDPKNYYWLKLEKGRLDFILKKDGREKVLASNPVETDSRKFKRLTANIHEGVFQAFFEGVNVLEVKDETFFSGKFFLFASGISTEPKRKTGTIQFDDIEVWNIQELSKGGRNEDVCYLRRSEGIPTINSVLDNYGSAGSLHPGDWHAERNETGMERFENEKFHTRTTGKALVFDGQWLAFNPEAFDAVHGHGMKAGYLISTLQKDDKVGTHRLWNSDLLYGNWRFRFRVGAKSDEEGDFGFCLKEIHGPTSAALDKYYEFSYDHRAGSLKNAPGLNLVIQRKDDEPGRKEGEKDKSPPNLKWHEIVISKTGENIGFHLDGELLGEYKNVAKNALLRPGILYSGGEFLFDTLHGVSYPDLIYEFQYSHPWRLAFSDWEFEAGDPSFRGNYYCFMNLKNGVNPVSMRSRRNFSGDTTAYLVANLEKTRDLHVGFEGESKESFCDISLTKDKLVYLSNGNTKIEKPLSGFSTENRVLTPIWLQYSGGYVKVFLNDDDGSARCALLARLSLSNEPYHIKISSQPELEIREVLIWGNEK